jgi:hypothetical protein
MESVESVAVKVGEPPMADFTVNVATPEADEVAEAGEIVSVMPRLEASVTVLPEIRSPLASLSVTVMVEVVLLSAGTEVGLAVTVELAAVGIATV